MGFREQAHCNQCDTDFWASYLGGFRFHLLHCDQCGKNKFMSFEELGEIHHRFLKGHDGPYSSITPKADRFIHENYQGDPLSKDQYLLKIEEMAGSCECGGRFTFAADPRCPKCRCLDFTTDPDKYEMYD